MRKFIDIKSHSLFQSDYIRLQSVMSSITISTSSSTKKKKKKRRQRRKREREGKERGGKEEKKKKGWKEFIRKERERGSMRYGKKDEKEGEEERRGRKRRIKNRKGGTKSVSPPPDVFPSAKLGNNMTPIRGRLGKTQLPQTEVQRNRSRIFRWIPGEDDQAS